MGTLNRSEWELVLDEPESVEVDDDPEEEPAEDDDEDEEEEEEDDDEEDEDVSCDDGPTGTKKRSSARLRPARANSAASRPSPSGRAWGRRWQAGGVFMVAGEAAGPGDRSGRRVARAPGGPADGTAGIGDTPL
jgi:hypothetical protein